MKTRLLFFVLLGTILPARGAETGFLRVPGAAEKAAALLESLPEDSASRFETPPRISGNEIVFELRDESRGEHSRLGELRLLDRSGAPLFPRVTKSFALAIDNPHGDERTLSRLVAAARAVARNDDGTFGRYAAARAEIAPPAPSYPIALIMGALASALLGAVLFGGPRLVVPAWRPAQILQPLTQGLIYFYWSLYWPGVAAHFSALLAQLTFAFLFDGCVSLIARRRWEISLSFFPLVMSINLFMWFADPLVALAVVAAAIASKTLFRRGESHVFNPSAFALACCGVVALINPSLSYQGLFHVMNIPPNMFETILLLSLIPQTRFPIALVSIGAFIGMGGLFGSPAALHPPMLIALTLLATDPATTPRSGGGKLTFGIFVGVGIWLLALGMARAGIRSDFAKVMPIPLANALAPWFDRLGSRLDLEGRWLGPNANGLHVALWLALVAPVWIRAKARHFNGDLQWSYKTAQIVSAEDGVPRCADNPAFCRPFSWWAETRLWRSRRP